MPSEIFNRLFDSQIPEGTEGNPAHYGLFVKNRTGLYMRLTQSEGNEIAYNPETQTRHLIGFEAPSDTIRQYQLNLSKNMLIRKGDPEYEFFNRYAERRPTGTNTHLQMMLVDFRKETAGTGGRFDYLAFEFTATVTINTANHTDGILDIGFGQASDLARGIASSAGFDEARQHPAFVPSAKIPIERMALSGEAVTLEQGGEAWITVDFEPLGAPDGFEIVRSGADAHDGEICGARLQLDSVVITGLAPGITAVKIRSSADSSKYGLVEVTVIEAGGGDPGAPPTDED